MTKSSMLALSNSIGPCTQIVEARLAVGHLEADRARRAGALRARAISSAVSAQARAVVQPAAAGGLGRLPLLLNRLGRAVAVVGAALGDEPLGHRAIPIEPLGLKVRRVRAADVRALRPSRARASAGRRGCRRPSPTTSARRRCLRCAARTCRRDGARKPVEERRAGAADVQVAGGRRGEADAGHRGNCTGIRDRGSESRDQDNALDHLETLAKI